MKQLSFLDRYLTLWIGLAMVGGIALGYTWPSFGTQMQALSWRGTNLPLAVGLILMMTPPLAKVDYSQLPALLRDRRTLGLSLVLNWVIGPVLMFALAVFFLGDEPHLMTGLILIGLARCIAMVLVWNDLADGSREYAAALVALNSLFQVFAYSALAWFFITYLAPKVGAEGMVIQVSMRQVAESVLLYLGVPFALGYSLRKLLVNSRDLDWYSSVFMPRFSKLTLISLLFTIVLMFGLKGEQLIQLPGLVLKVAVPMLVYFLLMFLLGLYISKRMNRPYDQAAAVAFTAAGNNFELAIAVAIGVFGLNSPEAFVGVIGPLVEVPALLVLVRVCYALKNRWFS